MARKRVSMREGPLAELFRATEAAQRGKRQGRPTRGRPIAARARPPTEILSRRPRSGARRSRRRRRRSPLRRRRARRARAASGRALARAAARATRRASSAPRDSASYLAVIRVVGVGGAGLNALDRMIDAGITQVDFIAVNTDIQQLQMSDAPTKIHIGSELTEGLGSGADPEIGRRAAEDSYDRSSARCAAPTWSSSPPARAAAPAPARRPSSRGSRASSAR